jgi:molybdate transport system ATP-binding protein
MISVITSAVLRLDGPNGSSGSVSGPIVTVPALDQEPGTAVMLEVRADDILLARGPIAGLSAQNLIPGSIDQILLHGPEAEVLVRTGGVTWIVSLVAPAVEQLRHANGFRGPVARRWPASRR